MARLHIQNELQLERYPEKNLFRAYLFRIYLHLILRMLVTLTKPTNSFGKKKYVRSLIKDKTCHITKLLS